MGGGLGWGGMGSLPVVFCTASGSSSHISRSCLSSASSSASLLSAASTPAADKACTRWKWSMTARAASASGVPGPGTGRLRAGRAGGRVPGDPLPSTTLACAPQPAAPAAPPAALAYAASTAPGARRDPGDSPARALCGAVSPPEAPPGGEGGIPATSIASPCTGWYLIASHLSRPLRRLTTRICKRMGPTRTPSGKSATGLSAWASPCA
mmetsp:Transcript_27173/g.73180  ORF Transcript_27173/g.73180 Transcript_27173/m.73180 type:complete len:210 (+) Transcript_27173:579-1208(+)